MFQIGQQTFLEEEEWPLAQVQLIDLPDDLISVLPLFLYSLRFLLRVVLQQTVEDSLAFLLSAWKVQQEFPLRIYLA